jgi:hypothetical protein
MRIYACAVAAEMIKHKVIGDRPLESDVKEAMGQEALVLEPDPPISTGTDVSFPHPAPSLIVDLELDDRTTASVSAYVPIGLALHIAPGTVRHRRHRRLLAASALA